MRFLIVLRGGAIAAILASLLIPQLHAQTQAAMNAQARAEFEQADAELNKTYQAVLKKLPDAESKQSSRKHSELGLRPAMPKPHVLLVKCAAARWLPRSATKQ